MKLKTPSAPFSPVFVVGESISIDTEGKVLVLPTGNPTILPSFNEYTLNSNRLTVTESPFGGLKGSGSPDYAPGTLFCQTDGVYLTDLSGTNSTKTLTAGKLKELSLLTVDTDAHTITEEFIVENTAESNNPTVIDSGDSAVGWGGIIGKNHSISSDGTKITVAGTTDEAGQFAVSKTISIDMSNKYFYMAGISDPVGGRVYLSIGTDESNRVSKTNCVISPNVPSFVICAAKSTTLANPGGGNTELAGPTFIAGTVNWSNVTHIRVGITGRAPFSSVTFSMYGVAVDSAKSAYIELQTPNNLAATSTIVQCWGGSAYAECRRDSLDGAYSNISSTPANMKMLDGTKFDDVYGSGLGRAYFPKGISGDTKAGSSGNITYSANKGTRNRIGFRIDLPPSDGGRTNFNKVRLKVITYYDDINGVLKVVPDISQTGNTLSVSGCSISDDGLGNKNSALVFDGISSSAIINNKQTSLGSQCTIIVRAKCDSSGGDTGKHIIDIRNTTPSKSTIAFRSGNSDIQIRDDNGVVPSAMPAMTYTSGEWRDYGVVATGTNIIAYKNGVQVDSKVWTGSFVNLNGWYISRTTNPTNLFKGLISEVWIYNRSLSPVEMTAITNNQPVSTTGLICHLKPIAQNMGATTYEFSNSTNASYGLQNQIKPWIALYDPATSEIDFYLFTHRPRNLSFKRNESGQIHELTLYPGNGLLYHGQIHYSDLTRDTDSNDIPDCLEASLEGSLSKFLQSYGMVI